MWHIWQARLYHHWAVGQCFPRDAMCRKWKKKVASLRMRLSQEAVRQSCFRVLFKKYKQQGRTSHHKCVWCQKDAIFMQNVAICAVLSRVVLGIPLWIDWCRYKLQLLYAVLGIPLWINRCRYQLQHLYSVLGIPLWIDWCRYKLQHLYAVLGIPLWIDRCRHKLQHLYAVLGIPLWIDRCRYKL